MNASLHETEIRSVIAALWPNFRGGDADWTRATFEALRDVGTRFGYESLYSARYGGPGEWLWDFLWCQRDPKSGHIVSLPLPTVALAEEWTVTEIATGVGILSMLVLPDIAAYLVLPLVGVAVNGTSSVLYATIGDLVEEDRLPRAFGLFYTLGSICGLVAPLAFGVIGDALGVEFSIALAGVLVFLTLPLCLMLGLGRLSWFREDGCERLIRSWILWFVRYTFHATQHYVRQFLRDRGKFSATNIAGRDDEE